MKSVALTLLGSFTLLLVLKLTGIVAWSWWWITLPLWIPLVLEILMVIGFFTLMTTANIFGIGNRFH